MPTTALGALSVPTTGSESGTWGSASLNPNFVALDGYGRGAVTLSLSTAASITLTAPSGSITPGAGPTQAQNFIIKLTGTLSGSPGITLPLPGYYIVENNCVGTAFVVALIPSAGVGGGFIYAPPGEPCHVYTDGTVIKYVNMGRVGSYVDLAVSSVPQWISGQSFPPYLLCDGTVYSSSIATALAAMIGSTFGGNGASTFGVPDLRNRVRVPVGNRITVAGGNFDGATLGAAGGAQSTSVLQGHLPSVNFNLAISDTRTFSVTALGPGGIGGPTSGAVTGAAPAALTVSATGGSIGGTAASGGSGNPLPTVPPALVAGITLIKT